MRLDLPPEIARKLDDAGFKYGSDLQRATPRDIMMLCSIGPWTVNLIFEEVGRKENNSFLLDEYRETIKKLHQHEDEQVERSRIRELQAKQNLRKRNDRS